MAFCVGLNSSVGIAFSYVLDRSGSNPGGGEIFRTWIRLAMGPTQPSIQWVSGLFPGGKAAEGYVNLLPPI